jgi:phage gp36-like protein
MANPLAVTLAASATVVASGQGAAVDIEAGRTVLILDVDVTGLVGTNAAVVLYVETSATGAGGWAVAAKLEKAITAEGPIKWNVGRCKRYVRLRWELGDTTTSATFAAAGVAHFVYAGPEDVESVAIPADALEDIAESDLVAGCVAATSEADGYLGNGFVMPLQSWGPSLTLQCARLAVWNAVSFRGFQPEGPDEVIRDNWKAAIRWLERIGAGTLSPPDIVDSTPDEYDAGAAVVSEPSRGW